MIHPNFSLPSHTPSYHLSPHLPLLYLSSQQLHQQLDKSPQLTSYSHSLIPPPLPYTNHHLSFLQSLLDDNPKPSAKLSLLVQSAPCSANPLKPCSMYPFPLALLVNLPSLWQPSVIASPTETSLDIPFYSLVSPPPTLNHRRTSTTSDLTEKTSKPLPAPTTCGTSNRPTNGNLTSGAMTRIRDRPRPSRAQQLAQQQQVCVHLT